MNRLKLSPGLPPRSAALKQFEEGLQQLNAFYWTYRCGVEHLVPALKSSKRVTDVIAGEPGKRRDLSCREFVADLPVSARMARYSVLVMSVTAFEEYLKASLTRFFRKNLSKERDYDIRLRPDELPKDGTLFALLTEKIIQAEVDELIRKSYSSRLSAIRQRLIDSGTGNLELSTDSVTYATAACEARNCIVHCGGRLDKRAMERLQLILPGIRPNELLELPEADLWKMLGGLRDSARAIDKAIRTQFKTKRLT
jgi:hypothetical protein